MEKIIQKSRVQDIENMEFHDSSGIISMRLVEVYEILESKYNHIEYQREDIPEDKRDNSHPAEGQYLGYDNEIRISPVNTVQVIQRCAGEINEYSLLADDSIETKKNTIIQKCNKLYNKLSELNGQNSVLDEKEEAVRESFELLEETVELFEEMEHLKQNRF